MLPPKNCTTCRNNDDQHKQLCDECIRVGGASGLPHYQEGTPDEIFANSLRVAAKRASHRHPEEVLAHMDTLTEDMVNLPKHYARFKIEPMRFVGENFGPTAIAAHIIPYIMRYDAKNGVEDLKKARRCLDMMILLVEGNPDWWKVPANG